MREESKIPQKEHGIGFHKQTRKFFSKPRKQTVIIVLDVIIIVLLIAIAVILYSKNYSSTGDSVAQSESVTVVAKEEDNIVAVASKVSPSVVSIIAPSDGVYTTSYSTGTGIIVSANGYVMTNKHVIDGATGKLTIIMSDGSQHDNVKVVGVDPLNDLAFLKISGVTDLTPAEIGDSSHVRVGQKVVAIGNARGRFQTTVTSGIISAKGRPLEVDDLNGGVASLSDLFQTDAAINEGNSGGPLVDIHGKVIGINTAIAVDAQGIGFAIPINATKGILKSLLDTGEVSRAYLGIRYVIITPDVAQEYDLSAKQGAYVFSDTNDPVVKGGPAESAGMKPKDVIMAVNGVKVGENGDLSTLVGEYAPGETIELTIIRGEKEQKISVKLGKY